MIHEWDIIHPINSRADFFLDPNHRTLHESFEGSAATIYYSTHQEIMKNSMMLALLG